MDITGERISITRDNHLFPLLLNYNSWQKQMWNQSPGDLSSLPMTITPLLPSGFPSTIISAWLLLHPRVRRGPRLPEKHRGEIFDRSFDSRLGWVGNIFWSLDEGLLTFLGPYPLPSFPALGTFTFQVRQSRKMNQYLIPVLVILALQSLMKYTRTCVRITNINKPAKYLSS